MIKSHIESHYPILYLVTREENHADQLIRSVCAGRKIMEWNMAQGLVDFDTKQAYASTNGSDLASALSTALDDERTNWVLVLRDAYLGLRDNPLAVSRLKALAQQIARRDDAHITVFLVAPVVHIPPELEKTITLFELPLPDEDEIVGLIEAFAQSYELSPSAQTLRELAMAFQGLTRDEIRLLLQRSYQSDGDIGVQHIGLIQDEKAQIIQKSGLLELVRSQENLTAIGGLKNLKAWLRQKSKILERWQEAREFGVEMPKGILLAGMPGCGKSLTAKATASLFKLPLLKMDMGALMGKYVGESEGNMRQALKVAEAVSPCVLWVDEVEKAFAASISGGAGSDVSLRMYGHFLTWMQEKTSQIFVIATANDIAYLPPELTRKGRFDEIFYVDFPTEIERKDIFKLHLGKRNKLNDQIDLEKLAAKTDQYSGADIEAVVKESIETAFINNAKELTTDRILKTISTTQPLGEVMKEQVDALKKKFEKMNIKSAS
jgi:AAA+ superfamily predicted ATPase